MINFHNLIMLFQAHVKMHLSFIGYKSKNYNAYGHFYVMLIVGMKMYNNIMLLQNESFKTWNMYEYYEMVYMRQWHFLNVTFKITTITNFNGFVGKNRLK